MSVQTTSDEEFDIFKQSLNNAITSLSRIVVDRVWGSEDYKLDVRLAMRRTLSELLGIRERFTQ